MAAYTYGMRLRGFSLGCQPMDGLIGHKDDPSGKYWDILVYNRELTDEEVRSYELDRIEQKEDKAMKANQILEKYHEECQAIAEQCEAEGYPSHGSNYELRCEQLWDQYYGPEYEEASAD